MTTLLDKLIEFILAKRLDECGNGAINIYFGNGLVKKEITNHQPTDN